MSFSASAVVVRKKNPTTASSAATKNLETCDYARSNTSRAVDLGLLCISNYNQIEPWTTDAHFSTKNKRLKVFEEISPSKSEPISRNYKSEIKTELSPPFLRPRTTTNISYKETTDSDKESGDSRRGVDQPLADIPDLNESVTISGFNESVTISVKGKYISSNTVNQTFIWRNE
jgi:hypothetical protein